MFNGGVIQRATTSNGYSSFKYPFSNIWISFLPLFDGSAIFQALPHKNLHVMIMGIGINLALRMPHTPRKKLKDHS